MILSYPSRIAKIGYGYGLVKYFVSKISTT